MIRIDIETKRLIKHLDKVTQRQLPFATMKALNRTAFETRDSWRQEMLKRFDRPTPFTQRSVLYKKATKSRLVAEVFLRDEALKGTPPARYLKHHTQGGRRPAKPMENLLRRAGVLGPSEFVVPGRGAQLDRFGNLPGRTITAILSDVRAQRDPTSFSTRGTRRKRSRRKRKRGGVFFYNRATQGRLRRGIYERIDTGFGSAVRSVLMPVSRQNYPERFDVEQLTRRLFERRFVHVFSEELRRALATAR